MSSLLEIDFVIKVNARRLRRFDLYQYFIVKRGAGHAFIFFMQNRKCDSEQEKKRCDLEQKIVRFVNKSHC